ncbi:MAG: AarF/ABC1/UbiB kinase family protein [Actinomycetota bacterium]|jgi:predicted unusual protein kinase regulating ubiquinone biosynthesis (AarF/ABC1/UbiB family)|nr:AarF/ABC1/UbiB kinase family protein [Actinomycetota bacterium]
MVPLAAAAALGAAATATWLADADRRHHLQRSARVWRLTTRRGLAWAVVRVRGRRAGDEKRARLEERFAIRTAEDVARELGNMKGVVMKAGQMVSFIAEGLPPEAKAALATLQADVAPMAPSLAEQVVREELGASVDRLFLDWDPVPVAAASIGQVHRAVMPDGALVAVKVQYPGIDRAITSDLDNAELLYGLFSSFALKGLDSRAIVDELRDRMGDELDYRLEATCQMEFAERYRGHPFIHVPDVVPERSARRVLTSEWVDGQRWEEFLATGDEEAFQRAGEVLFRFAQGSVHRHRVFNGDPHPGNYRFHPDGSVTFLDFGLVKRFTTGELEQLTPVLDPLLARDAVGTTRRLVDAGFLVSDHGLDPEVVWDYVSNPYSPYLVEEFTFTQEWVADALHRALDLSGPAAEVVKRLDMPPSFVILDRVVWGMSALLGRLVASGRWRGILEEYRKGAPPVTELGRAEAAWMAERARAAGER